MADSNYIAIEGVVGAGKTTLAKLIGKRLDAMLILEEAESNPFLPDFYRDPRRYAFQTQMFFLLSRYKQQEELPHPDLFHRWLVADYIFAKDRIFAAINLDEREMALYDRVSEALQQYIRPPDLVIYLQSSIRRLINNIRIRNRSYERDMPEEYIRLLSENYNRYFLNYMQTPLIIVNADNSDFLNKPEQVDRLIDMIKAGISGMQYYNPAD